ncbi:hypothetical protein [Elizabethkingia meningoseptica]|uniref:hypothetical protein n=1 Tax=Elizabethkingia meningoseptica TaxID=238 RepID=UPI0020118785|nr:hypothetical protein [Elizabethkingia meningoseptica]MCL1675937.1 hypothetical protein [Elizabethkingia meningoseptica]MCL1686417.1 hypothetical protein [Elizabethkingia meningoseptica]
MNDNQSTQTLFRFVSQRNAQLIDTEEKISFIKRSKSIKSVFDQAIIQWANQNAEGVTKLDALTAKAKDLRRTGEIQLFTKVEEVAAAAGSFHKAGKQLAIEGKISPELETELKAFFTLNAEGKGELTSSAPLKLTNIWDNFIYQVVTQEDFYVKEAVSQVLKAYNYIKNIIPAGADKNEVLKQAIDAKIVLPPVLFLDDYPVEQDHAFQVNVSRIGQSYISAKKTARAAEAFPQKSELSNLEIAQKANSLAAAYYKENLQNLRKELKKAKKSYDAGYDKAYKAALKKHDEIKQNTARSLEAIEPLEFRFEYGVSSLDTEFLSTKLSAQSMETLALLLGKEENFSAAAFRTANSDESENLSLEGDEYQNVDEVITAIDEQINTYNEQINDNTIISKEEYASIGGVLIPIANNFVSDGENTKNFTATTVAKSNTGWSVLLELNDKSLSIVSASYQAIASGGLNTISDSSAVFMQNGTYTLFNNNTIPVQNFGSNGFIIKGEIVLSDNKVYQLNFTMIVNSFGEMNVITNTYPYTGGGVLYYLDETPQSQSYEGEVCASYYQAEQNLVKMEAKLKIPDNIPLIIGSYRLMNGKNIVKESSVSDFYIRANGTVLLSDLFNNSLLLAELQQSNKFVLDATIDGNFKQLVLNGFNTLTCATGTFKDAQDSNEESNGETFIPKGFGIRRLGIADYLKVEQSTHAYVEGEVANIENIMAREYREKSTRRLRRSENTTTTSKETEQEKLTDTTTATRFEMQTEIAKMLQESNDASFSASSGFEKWGASFNVASGYANHRSKEDSTRQATTQAQDITERALDRVVSKVREERIEKITEEFEENNSHGFDNRKGDKHVVGVYRWVDKLMKNQIFNYGKRMMFEFMVPQPSKMHNLALQTIKSARVIEKPVDPRNAGEKSIKDYTFLTNDYLLRYWTGYYNVEIEERPQETKTLAWTYSFSKNDPQAMSVSKDQKLEIPNNYKATGFNLSFTGREYEAANYGISVANQTFNSANGPSFPLYRGLPNITDEISISMYFDRYWAGSVNIVVDLIIAQEIRLDWLQRTYNAIINAYEKAMTIYNQSIAEEEARATNIKENNANFYRQIEQDVLKHNCIAYMVDPNLLGTKLYNIKDESLETYEVLKKKLLDDYAALVKFMEQAFEWDIMSYNFYPYFWGNKADWQSLYQSESIDPLFRSFLQSGMARVVATVRPGFEDAVQFYMATGKIWSGGEVPVIGDPLYLSIVDEMRETPGDKYGKAWITRIPTALTILQAESIGLKVEHALPFTQENPEDFEDPKALVTESNFEKNNAAMQSPDSKTVGNMEINNDYLQLTTKDDPKQVVAQLSLDDLKEALQ